ncbi:MAG: guanylate kinase [Deltaproteobacteria bacterium]|nr:guanylate kinase [Deltaproteobacteria bacterium]
MVVILTAPSGTGKTTVAAKILKQDAELTFSVSHTTRPIRDGEQDGVNYHYVDDATFDSMVESGAFAEWAHVHKRRYGTSLREVERSHEAGQDVLLDIDPQGGVQLMETYPDAVTIFMVPPSMIELERRLRGRGTEDEDQISTRLGVAREEIGYAARYDYLVVNDVVDRAADAIAAILQTERNRTSRNGSFIRELQAQGETS